MSLISVIVPVYGVEMFLPRCINSILSQTYHDFELVLVDDGSPDNCGKICDEYEAQDSRVHVIHQDNRGVSAARNTGIEYAYTTDSEWIAFIDSDDWIDENYLDILLSAATELKSDIASCFFQSTSGEINDIGSVEFSTLSPEDFWIEDRVNATVSWGKLYKKKCFETVRFPVGKLHEDEFTTYKCLFACNKIAVVRGKLYFYFQNPNGIMKSGWKPERAVVTDALQEQTAFFYANHYEMAWKRNAVACLTSLVTNYRCASSNSYPELAKKLRKNLKEEYKKVGKKLELNKDFSLEVKKIINPFIYKPYSWFKLLCLIIKENGIKGFFKKLLAKVFH